MEKKILGVIISLFILSLFSACSGDLNFRDIRIFRNTEAWELAKAVDKEDTGKITRVAARNPAALDLLDPIHGMTLLFWAIGMEKYDSAEALLKAGADPDIISTYEGGTALYRAAGFSFVSANKDSKFVELLLAYGADPNIGFVGNIRNNTPEIGTTPLMQSIGVGIEKTKALVNAGADINFKTESGRTAAIKALMSAGAGAVNEMKLYAHYLIADKKACITNSYFSIFNFLGDNPSEFYPVNLLRSWMPELDSEWYLIKMEIVEEFARQGVDYWETEISRRDLERIQRRYPDTWEEYIKWY